VNAGTGDFGRWLLAARETLAGGGAIDLRVAPPEVQWIRLDAATADQQRIQAARTAAPCHTGRFWSSVTASMQPAGGKWPARHQARPWSKKQIWKI
jgi:hypothetical protein